MTTITQSLRDAITDSGQTIYRVAKDNDIHSTVVMRFYKDERSLTLETADKLADYFGLELRPREKPAAKRKRRK